jgi:hypothetical protein
VLPRVVQQGGRMIEKIDVSPEAIYVGGHKEVYQKFRIASKRARQLEGTHQFELCYAS